MTVLGHDEGRRQAHSAAPFGGRGVLVLRRSLESLGGVQGVVRRSLVAAAFVALAVALVAGIVLAARLVRRLAALRSTALQVAEQGPGETPPVDDGHRDEVGDLARAFATMQRRLAAQEQSRRTFVEHRVARAAHAADLARADAPRRDRGAHRRPIRTCRRRATSCGARSARPSG